MPTSLDTFLRPDKFFVYLLTSSELLMTAAFVWLEDYADALNAEADGPPEDEQAEG